MLIDGRLKGRGIADYVEAVVKTLIAQWKYGASSVVEQFVVINVHRFE